MSGDDGFFTRWSRRKTQQRDDAAPGARPARAQDLAKGVAHDVAQEPARETAPAQPPQVANPTALPAVARESTLPAPTLDDVAMLTPQSDYSRFVGAGVDTGVQHAALKKLFSDPRFNVMDGLDTYIGDYNTPDPIPDAMLRCLRQSKELRLFDVPDADADGATAADMGSADVTDATDATATTAVEGVAGNAPETSPDGAPASTLSQSAAAQNGDCPPEPRTDEDTALRLQPDDAADAAGAGPHRPGPRA